LQAAFGLGHVLGAHIVGCHIRPHSYSEVSLPSDIAPPGMHRANKPVPMLHT
jgi:hypothetical protein